MEKEESYFTEVVERTHKNAVLEAGLACAVSRTNHALQILDLIGEVESVLLAHALMTFTMRQGKEKAMTLLKNARVYQ